MAKIEDDPVYNQPKPKTSSDQPQTTADDPVYNQPKPASEPQPKPDDQSSNPTRSEKDSAIADDPTYNQPKPDSSDEEARPVADDPVYNQPKPDSSSKPKVDAMVHDQSATRVSTKEPRKVADDPVYNQPKPKSSNSDNPQPIADDPVYNQPKSESSDETSRPVADDPVYNQPKPKSQPSSVADDPTYNQPTRMPPAGDDSDYSPSSSQQTPLHKDQDGKGEITEDPVYNQPKLPSFETQVGGGDDADYGSQPRVNSQNRASERLIQLNQQIAPAPSEADIQQPGTQEANTSAPRRQRKKKAQDHQSSLPADYSDIMGHISTIQNHARNPPADHRGYTRQKAAGKMTSRDRIDTILNPGTFRELGSVTGTTTWSIDPENPLTEKVEDFTPSNNPQGFGQVTCLQTGTEKVTRQIYLTSDDFSIRGGHADGHNGLKTLYGEKLALRLKVPVVKLVDGSSGGGSSTLR